MHCPKISFNNAPNNILKCRSDFQSIIKGEDDKCCSLNIADIGSLRCHLMIRLLLKDPGDVHHFYHLCKLSDKSHVMKIEQEVPLNQSKVKLDFFGIKKALKKDAMIYLKEKFQKNADEIYKKNLSTVVLEISLIDSYNRHPYDVLTFEFCDKTDKLVVKAYSPKFLLIDDTPTELTFVLESPEKDTESITLEMDVENLTKTVRVKELIKPTSIKNVFIFTLRLLDIRLGAFKARLYRKGAAKAYSDWMDFSVCDSVLEKGKRKTNSNYDDEPEHKIPRSISTSISENSLSDVNITDYISSPSSTFSFIRNSTKQDLKCIFETRLLSSIARVGHDFAFGRPVTDSMLNITEKLPVVYILQDDVGDSPLHNAILKNQEGRAIDILKIVSKHFPNDLFTRNTSNHTALILSAACDVSADFVQRLLFHGFNVTDKDCDGNNALSIAIEYKNTKILDTLVQEAIIKEAFDNDLSEVLSLVQKAIRTHYFEGFQLLMKFKLALYWSYEDMNLESNFMNVFYEFRNRLNLDVTPLAELNVDDLESMGDDFDVDLLLESDYR